MKERLNRAFGCLAGAGIGDAMGMPASFFTRTMIKETYGYIDDFLEPEPEVQVYHKDLGAGQITDDTQETLIVADVLIKKGYFDEGEFNRGMAKWAINANILESTVIGPSTRRFLTGILEGTDTKEGAKTATTNGSAMRVAPVGIFFWNDFAACMEAAANSSMPSHGSDCTVAAACAVASACAAGVKGGFTPKEVMEIAIRGAEYGEGMGYPVTAPSLSKRLKLAVELVDRYRHEGMDVILDELVGIFGASMQSYESVTIALGVFYAVGGNAREGILASVNGGDDADTNGSICGAVCGAYSGASAIPSEWISRVERTAGLDFLELAKKLIKG